MLSIFRPETPKSYGYRFTEGPNHVAQIWAIGWEHRTSTSYYWDGMERKETGRCVFQYTLSGQGIIEMENEVIEMKPGQAFFVSIPSNHRYYLPDSSKSWEFIFIMLYGNEALNSCAYARNAFGPVAEFHPNSSLVHCLLSLYKQASENKIKDAYQGASLAFQFIMELYRSAQFTERTDERLPSSISQSIDFIHSNFSNSIGLEDIARSSGLSKYHFNRLFRKAMGTTPVQYLTKVRIENSLELLRLTNKSTEEIAQKVGYANGNYFCKVFREYIGETPQEFRIGKGVAPVDQIIID